MCALCHTALSYQPTKCRADFSVTFSIVHFFSISLKTRLVLKLAERMQKSARTAFILSFYSKQLTEQSVQILLRDPRGRREQNEMFAITVGYDGYDRCSWTTCPIY